MSYIDERRQEEKDRRRIEIVTAAEAMYLELGWDAVTMDSVARRARLSRALVYVYFKDKRDLHFAIVLRALDILREQFEAAVGQARTGIEKIEAIGRAYLAFAQEYPHYFDACARLEAQVPHPSSLPPTPPYTPAASLPGSQPVLGAAEGPVEAPALHLPAQAASSPSSLPPAHPATATADTPLSTGTDPRQISMFEASRPIHEIVVAVLADGQRDGTIRKDIGDLIVTSHVLWGFTHGTIQIAVTKAAQLAEADISAAQLIEHAVALALQMLTDPRTPPRADTPLAGPGHGTTL